VPEPLPSFPLDELAKVGASTSVLPRLAEVHEEIWRMEDRARSRLAGDPDVADAKRKIDALNAERHELIDRIDAGVPAGAPGPSAVPYPETFGELCDRALILRLKARHSDAHAADPTLPAGVRRECEAQAERFRRWLAHVELVVERMLADLEAGRAALPPRAELKMYNDEVLNPVTRAEMTGTTVRRRAGGPPAAP
jgi:Protein of unknown function (DUF4254)